MNAPVRSPVPFPGEAAKEAAHLDRLWNAFRVARIKALASGDPEAVIRASEAFGALLSALYVAGERGRNVFRDHLRRQSDRQA